MIKKVILVIILFFVVFHMAWYAGSRIYQNRKLPHDKVLREYQDKMVKQLKLNIDRTVMEEAYIDANGCRLHLIIAVANKNAPNVVFIPGTTAYAAVYAQFGYDMYKQGFNIIGFDPRGHGRSSGSRGNYTMTELVDDTLAVVKYVRNRFGGKVAIAGSSQGGMAAFYAAALDNSIDAVVCHNIADLNGKDNLVLSQIRPPQFMVPFCIFLMNLYENYSFPIALYLDLTKEKFPDGTDAATLIKKDPLAISWITFRALNSLLRTDMAKPVEKISVPIMLIHSGKDSIFPQSYVEGIYNRLTCKKKYLLLMDASHLVMTNNVPEIVPPIAAWLRDIMQ